MHLTKETVEAFEEMTTGKFAKYAGIMTYRRKPMNKWLLLRFRFAMWRMKTFRLFKKPLCVSDDTVK